MAEVEANLDEASDEATQIADANLAATAIQAAMRGSRERKRSSRYKRSTALAQVSEMKEHDDLSDTPVEDAYDVDGVQTAVHDARV